MKWKGKEEKRDMIFPNWSRVFESWKMYPNWRGGHLSLGCDLCRWKNELELEGRDNCKEKANISKTVIFLFWSKRNKRKIIKVEFVYIIFWK